MVLHFRDWRRLRRRALAAQRQDQSEVCGLIGERDGILQLWFMPNLAGPGSWKMSDGAMAQAIREMDAAGVRMLGTFHSHPISEAVPGTRDIDAMRVGEGLQLIYDVCGVEARL